MCSLMAPSGHAAVNRACPLSGHQRTNRGRSPRSQFDPTETSRLRLIGAICSSLASRKVLGFGYCTRQASMRDSVRRRDFITILGGAAAWPLAVRAQQSSRMKRIAIVSPATKIGDMSVNGTRQYRVFFEELGRLGYVEGQNLVVERYSGEGRTEHYADLARDVVNTHPDLIFCISYRLALNFKAATTTIPIVAITGDP